MKHLRNMLGTSLSWLTNFRHVGKANIVWLRYQLAGFPSERLTNKSSANNEAVIVTKQKIIGEVSP